VSTDGEAAVSDGYDAFEAFERFNQSAGATAVLDPYPDPAAPAGPGLRRVDDPTAGDTGLPPIFTTASYEAAQDVLRDGERFSSAGYAEFMGPVLGRTILEMDAPDHHAHRSLVQPAFTRVAMERWEVELVVPIVDGLIDRFTDRGQADLVRELFFLFPIDVIAGMLGLPEADLPQFHRWAVELISGSFRPDVALTASADVHAYLLPMVAARRAAPGGDLVSLLATAEHEGERSSDDAIISFCRLLLPAGAETTYRSSSNLACGLLRHPEQLRALREDRALLGPAIEEALRWEPPLLTIVRTATRATTVAGVDVPAGAAVIVDLGAANHDAARWDDPARFDITRSRTAHIAFAAGPHTCLGMHLARMETRVVLDRLLDRLPDLRLDPDAPEPVITGGTFRAPAHLHVVF
jgi:cytochrome P450